MTRYLDGRYEAGLLVLSYFIAVFAVYSAIDFAYRILRHPQRTGLWLGLGTATVGCGLWSMHFIALQALSLPIALGYDAARTAVSLLAALGLAALGLWLASRKTVDLGRVAFGALLMGVGFCAMQYAGLSAMRLRPGIIWSPALAALAVVAAVATAGLSLTAIFQLRSLPPKLLWPARLGAALVLGLAILGTHALGMAAARIPATSLSRATHEIAGAAMAAPVALFAIALTLLALGLAAYDARHLALQRAERLRREQDQRARVLALHDPETMLRNRASFQQEAVNFIQRCTRNGTKFDLFYGALRFPEDSRLEARAMQAIAERLRPLARPQDFLARYGRTEFALLRVRDPLEGAPLLLRDQLLSACTLPLEIDGQRIHPQAHVGNGTFPDHGRSSRELLMAAARTADLRMSTSSATARPVAA